eukprot:Nk52_evm7s240 gene=Nk52_evmTU7s240
MSVPHLSVFKLIFTIVLVNIFLFTSSCQASRPSELLRDVHQLSQDLSFYNLDNLVVDKSDFGFNSISGLYSELTPALTYQGSSSLEIFGVRSSSKNPYVTHFVDSYGYSHVNCSYNPFKTPSHHHNYNVISKFGISCDENSASLKQVKYYSFLENAFTSSIIVSWMGNVSINSPFTEQDPGTELDIDGGHASIYGFQVENLSVNDTVANEFIATEVNTLELNNLLTANFKANDVPTISGNVILPFLSDQSPKFDLVGMNNSHSVNLNITWITAVCSEQGSVQFKSNTCFDLIVNGNQVPCVNNSMSYGVAPDFDNTLVVNLKYLNPSSSARFDSTCINAMDYTPTFNRGLLNKIPYALRKDALPESSFQYEKLSLNKTGTQIVNPLINAGAVSFPAVNVLMALLAIALFCQKNNKRVLHVAPRPQHNLFAECCM